MPNRKINPPQSGENALFFDCRSAMSESGSKEKQRANLKYAMFFLPACVCVKL